MPTPGFPAEWGLSPHLRELPAATRDEVLALFPAWFRDSDSAIRDQILDALLEAFAKKASRIAEYAATANEKYAEGSELDLLGSKRVRALFEGDDPYRARLLGEDDDPSPQKILDAIEAILAPFTPKKPYYCERPDDDIFIFSAADTRERGFYVDGKRPIRKSTRYYARRRRCEPKHGLMWATKRGSAETTDTPVSPPLIRGIRGDDTTAPDNAYGHCLIGLPAVRPPGSRRLSDAIVLSDPTAGGTVSPLTAGGELTPAAAKAGRIMSSIFDVATLTTRLATNKPTGPAIYASDRDAATIVDQVRSLMKARGAFPMQFTILLDPAI